MVHVELIHLVGYDTVSLYFLFFILFFSFFLFSFFLVFLVFADSCLGTSIYGVFLYEPPLPSPPLSSPPLPSPPLSSPLLPSPPLSSPLLSYIFCLSANLNADGHK